MAKVLYEFTVNKEIEEEISNESVGEDGKITIVKEKVKTNKPFKFALMKPRRAMFDEAEVFFGVTMGKMIKAGMLTRNMLGNKYDNEGGTFSEPEIKEMEDLLKRLLDLENQYRESADKLKEDPENEDLKKKVAESGEEIIATRRELIRFQSKQDSIYNETAEVKARNKTILWWILMLALKDDNKGGYEPFFSGEGFDNIAYDKKLKSYDEYEERDDEFEMLVIRYFTYLVSFWYRNAEISKEQFDELIKDLNAGLSNA